MGDQEQWENYVYTHNEKKGGKFTDCMYWVMPRERG